MKTTKILVTMLGGLLLSGTAQATLIDRGGGLIYDDVLNVTWLQNANVNGAMDWNTAVNWADNFSYYDSVRNVTYTDWRLPTMLGANVSAACNFGYNNTNCGYNVDPLSSEMAHLFHTDLGNISPYNTSGSFIGGIIGVNWGLVNTGPFTNFQHYVYWSGTQYASNNSAAWFFDTSFGGQSAFDTGFHHYALAVRPGDVAAVSAVPLPATLPLLLTGLGLLAAARRRGRLVFR